MRAASEDILGKSLFVAESNLKHAKRLPNSTSMNQPQETGNEGLWTDVADAAFASAEECHSQRPTELYLIRHTRSRAYFSYGQWTLDAAEAQAFRSGVIAMSVAEQCGLRGVELVLQTLAAPPHAISVGANGWD